VGRVVGLIIAAGFGTRISSAWSKPKSLIELEPGVTVLDFIVSRFREVGIDDIYVATREEVAHFFEEKLPPDKILIVDVRPGDGNLWTFARAVEELARKGIEADVVVSMSDHIYERRILKKLVDADRGASEPRILLCLDRKPRGREAYEGLKIAESGGSVVRAGKGIPPYSGVDTGLFYVPRQLIGRVLEVVGKLGRGASFSDLINELSREGLVGYVDVTGMLWCDIDIPEDIYTARKLYWRIVKRDLVKETDGYVSRYINRPISTAISVELYKRRIFVDPNLVTVVVGLIGLAASAALLMGNPIAAALLLQLNSILDGVDGEIARLFRRSSRFGALLDNIFDRLVDVVFMSSVVAVMVSQGAHVAYAALIGGAALSGSVLVSFVSNFVEDRELVARARRGFPPATRDVRALALALSVAAGFPDIGLLYVAAASWIFVAKVLAGYINVGIPAPRRLFEKLRLPFERAVPEAPPRILDVVEEVLLYAGLFALLAYTANSASHYLAAYREVLGDLVYVVGRALVVLGAASAIFFAVKAVLAVKSLADIVKDRVVEALWIAPSVYESLALKALLIAVLVVLHLNVKPLSLALALPDYIGDLIGLAVSAALIALILLALLDAVRALEHKLVKQEEERR